MTPIFAWNGLILVYILGGQEGRPHSTMERATERTSATRLHICEVCNKSFTRKDNLSRHLSVHGEKSFQYSHCSICYSQQVKLKVHTFRHHTNEKQKVSNKLLSCGYCSKILGRSFNFRRHMAVWKKKLLSKPHLIWKKWYLKWLVLRGSIVEICELGRQF